jgi:hypothetical protein
LPFDSSQISLAIYKVNSWSSEGETQKVGHCGTYPATGETKTGGLLSPGVWGQSGQHRETLFLKQTINLKMLG